jgi:hypothetical protein
MSARSSRLLRSRLAAVLLAFAAAAGPVPAAAAPDATDLVLHWLRGGWRSPLLCTFSGQPRQGVRRVVIVPGPPQSERRVDRITFSALDAGQAERCRNPLGGDAPNLIGSVLVGYTPRRPHSDTPQRDFEQLLEAGRFDLDVVAGRLRVGPTSAAPESLPEVEFAGGRAEVGEIPPGSDVARMLVDFGPRRRLWLALEAPDGTRVELPLVQFERR